MNMEDPRNGNPEVEEASEINEESAKTNDFELIIFLGDPFWFVFY